MINQISLKNFKSWRDSGEINFAPITGFFGTNSSGKSSLIQFLLMLKQTTEATNPNLAVDFGNSQRSRVDLGTFEDVIHNRKTSDEFSWTFDWTTGENSPEEKKSEDTPRNHFQHFAAIGFLQERVLCTRFGYRWPKKGLSYTYQITPICTNPFAILYQFTMDPPLLSPEPEDPSGVPPWKCYGLPTGPRFYLDAKENGFPPFSLCLEQKFQFVYHLGPLREFPSRQYIWGGDDESEIGAKGERAIQAILASRTKNAPHSKSKASELETHVARWLKKLGLVDSFQVKRVSESANLYQIWIKTAPGAKPVLITDVGFGISQILPVLVLCYHVPKGSTIILEQPEIHLHPSAQSALADVFIDAMKTRKIQIILESHSEHLLRRLQRRIAEGSLDREDVALHFCSFEKGESHIEALEVDPYGNILNWPKNFFGNDFEEIAAIAKAGLERKLAESR